MNEYNEKKVQERMTLSHSYGFFENGLYRNHRLQEAVISIMKNIPVKELENFENFLDLGCGQGQWMNFLNVFLFGRPVAYGIDLSQHQINALKVKFPTYYVECSNMTNLSYENNKFNLITAFTSLMFLKEEEELEKVFFESNRTLKSGGYFLIEDVYKEKGHFYENQLIDTGIAGYNMSELDKYAIKYGFERVAFKPVFKRLLWSKKSRLNTVNLPSYMGYTLTYLSELFIPGVMNNFILLYKKVK